MELVPRGIDKGDNAGEKEEIWGKLFMVLN